MCLSLFCVLSSVQSITRQYLQAQAKKRHGVFFVRVGGGCTTCGKRVLRFLVKKGRGEPINSGVLNAR